MKAAIRSTLMIGLGLFLICFGLIGILSVDRENESEVRHVGKGIYRIDWSDDVVDQSILDTMVTDELQELKEHENKIILAEPNGLIFIPIKLPLELYEQNLNGTYTVYEDDKIMVFSIYMEDILTVADVTGY